MQIDIALTPQSHFRDNICIQRTCTLVPLIPFKQSIYNKLANMQNYIIVYTIYDTVRQTDCDLIIGGGVFL